MTKKIALLTTFYEAESGYSLIAVAETQIRMLLDHGYSPAVLVQEDFQQSLAPSIWRSEVTDLRPAIPFMHLDPGLADDFEGRVAKIEAALGDALADAEVCITHDIVLQEFYKEHNVAVRRYAKTRPDLLWLHCIHSRPSYGRASSYPLNCRSTPPPGYIVYPNDIDRAQVVQIYGLDGQEWRVKACRAGHAVDPLLLWPYDRLTRDLALKADLVGGDVVAVYPARLDRGKQVEKIVRLMAGVKKSGHEPRLLVIDWQSAGERFQKYIDELQGLAASYGLENEVFFTSRLDDRCSQGVPRRVVVELMDLSNVYIHPSKVETYSLVVHEAILRGNLAVLNHDLPPMRELYGDNAIYMDFGSDWTRREYHPNEQAFWNDEAGRLVAELRQNRALWAKTVARREWSPQALWKEFVPLLHLQPVAN